MKVSLVLTVLNEEKTIEAFLDSIEAQSLKPDEVVIIDGGSTDWTLNKLLRPDMNLRVLVYGGSNRSQGRNRGIQLAKNEIIAITDCGCILDKNWLLEITKPFKDEKVDVVAGYYLAKGDTVFQKSVAPYFCVMPREVEKREEKKGFEFLPSSRSLALKKSVWAKVGGYPEELDYCEDLAFDQKIKKSGIKFHFAPKAIVYWPQRGTLKGVARQFFNYATGDGQIFFSKYQTHSFNIIRIFFVYIYALFLLHLTSIYGYAFPTLLIFVVVYLLWPIIKHYRHVKKIGALFWLPVLKVVADIAVMSGVLMGFYMTLTKKKKLIK